METLQEYLNEYRKQMQKGIVQRAYHGLLEYIIDLRMHFGKKFPDFLPGNIYQGHMDMTYFPIFPIELKSKKLKIAIVFIHETIQFEAWLAAQNKQLQAEYRDLFKKGDWNNYRIPADARGTDAIMEYTLAEKPNFNDPDALIGQIEKGTLTFINDVQRFLYKHQS